MGEHAHRRRPRPDAPRRCPAAHRRSRAWPPSTPPSAPARRWSPAAGDRHRRAARRRSARRPLLRGLVRPPAGRSRRRHRARPAAGRPARRTSATRPVLELVRGPGRRRARATRRRPDVDPEPGLQRAGLRLADRGRAAQPAGRRDRAAAARDAGLRLPERRGAGRSPSARSCAGAARHGSRADARRTAPTSRSRSSAWPAAIPAASAARRSSGSWSRPAGDGIAAFPDDRGWDLEALYHPDPDHPGTTYTRQGGFLPDAADFDPGLFGISPARGAGDGPAAAAAAGDRPGRRSSAPGSTRWALRGTRTGVFAGVMYHDYASVAGRAEAQVEGFLGTGTPAASRPAGCPTRSGLRARRSRSTRRARRRWSRCTWPCRRCVTGECELALAGGVTVMATPDTFVEFSRQRGLAADGRCKSFAERRRRHRLGRGCRHAAGRAAVGRPAARPPDPRRGAGLGGQPGRGVQRADRAERPVPAAGDPAGAGQRRSDVAGRGRRRGARHRHDARRPDRGAGAAGHLRPGPAGEPLWLGSIKSNLGHTQAAAGVAGIIKMVQAMRHGHAAPDAARGRADPAGGLVGRVRSSC